MKNIFKKYKNIKNHRQSGFTIIEVLIACVIISVAIIALMSSASKGIELSNRALRQVQASLLMEEGAEAVKSIRDNNWDTISSLNLDTNYYLSFDTDTHQWTIEEAPISPIDGIFTRTVVFSSVNRDVNDDISSSGYLDSGIKNVQVSVSWPTSGGINSKNLTFYLANIFN